MKEQEKLSLRLLWHPGAKNTISGFGLPITSHYLIGFLHFERKSFEQWRRELLETFDEDSIIESDDKVIVACVMHIAPESLEHLKPLEVPLDQEIIAKLISLRNKPHKGFVSMRWDEEGKCWQPSLVRAGHIELLASKLALSEN